MLAKSKTYAETTYGCQVQTVVTDNARNMVKMRDAIEQVINVVIVFLNFGTYVKYITTHIKS